MSSSSALPPLNNLPSWSRVSSLDRSRYPKPFLRDRLQTLPPTTGKHGAPSDTSHVSMDIQLLDNLNAVEQQRLVYYDKSIKFLQQQHTDTLKKLHEEIDQLKQENKELQFKFIMGHVTDSSTDQQSSSSNKEISKSTRNIDIQSMLLHEEVKDLRLALKNAQGRNMLLQHALHIQNKRKKSSAAKVPRNLSPSDSVFSPEQADTALGHESALTDGSPYLTVTDQESPLPFGATLNPLRIRSNSEAELRSPSIEECEVIINYLNRLSARQKEENQLLKADLKTVLYPNKSGASEKTNLESKKLKEVVKKNDKANYQRRSEKSPARKIEVYGKHMVDELAKKGKGDRTSGKALPWRHALHQNPKREGYILYRESDELKLPRVSFKDHLPDHKIQNGASPDRVSLPALKHTINTNVADRKKRQQAVQKARGRRDPHFQHLP